jgi:capsular polysaccharide biosynthesis protein
MYTPVVHSGQTLREYGTVLRMRWRWVMWGVLLALFATTLSLLLRPPFYRSDATVFVRTPGDVSRVGDGGEAYARARARTYAVLAGNRGVSERVISDVGFDMTPDTLAGRITAENRAGTGLIDIAVHAPSADEAERTATVLLSEVEQTVRQLESVPGSLIPRAELVVVDPPRPATRVVAFGTPIPWTLLGMALLGAFAGAIVAVIRAIFRPSRRRQSAGGAGEAPGAGDSGSGEFSGSGP